MSETRLPFGIAQHGLAQMPLLLVQGTNRVVRIGYGCWTTQSGDAPEIVGFRRWGIKEEPDITGDQIQGIIGECVFVRLFRLPIVLSTLMRWGLNIVQPGGSIRDEGGIVSACNKYGIAMAFTGSVILSIDRVFT